MLSGASIFPGETWFSAEVIGVGVTSSSNGTYDNSIERSYLQQPESILILTVEKSI